MEPDGPERDPVADLDLARIEGARRHLTDRVHVTPILGSGFGRGPGGTAGLWTTPLVRHYLEDIVLVSDTEILAALRFALERTKQVLEPAGATGLAALLAGRIPYRDGERVVVVFSGGNVDLAGLARLLDAAPGPAAGGVET